ncbi:MAG: AAA family ATPase [Lachnospiraceae bacterium]|nr:AAA family ATPase [Lachnospiraceae bacterium]
MLIRFNVKNFLSFSEREDGKSEEFSMIAGKVRSKKEHLYEEGKIKLLKFAAVYGANAAGKSNLVKALDFMQKIVLSGLPEGHTDNYCKVARESKDKASYFELEIFLNQKYYAYGFEVILNQSRFTSEWLVELSADSKEKLIFSRDIMKGTYEFGGEANIKGFIEKLNVYAEDIQEDGSVLLLSIMNQNKKTLYQQFERAVIFQDVYMWIKNKLNINYPERPISDYSYMAETENVEEICRMTAAFGTGITDFRMVEVPVEKVLGHLPKRIQEDLLADIEKKTAEMKADLSADGFGIIMRSYRDFFILDIDKEENIICKTIQFSHGKKNILFELSEESDGTVRLLDLLEVLLSGAGKTYVIDELDRCLHPSLTYKFVETFLKLASQKNIQLIVTTHELRLLDFDLLRRDEVWFVNKRKSGESDIYSLEEYDARFDQKIDKAYLEGRYGGVPVFNPVFPVRKVRE